jgi:hypothetical protein
MDRSRKPHDATVGKKENGGKFDCVLSGGKKYYNSDSR